VVLNGTSVYHLANDTSVRLGGLGYTMGTPETAASQTVTTTVVAYTTGHEADAVQVAKALKLPPSAVQPVTQDTLQVACPPPGSCTADVVVTLGADMAGTATTSNSGTTTT
jgi:hypothetical protein